MSANSITAKNAAISGDEDTVIALLLEGAATDSHFAVTGFEVTQLPTNGTLYLDSALTIPVTAGSVLRSATGSLPLYFRPAQDFHGTIDFKYVSKGIFVSASPGEADAYYLTLSGVDGGVRADGHDGAFAVKNFTFDIEQVIDSASGTGSGKGKAEPGPLIVDLVPGSSLTVLLKNDASGKHFGLLRLQGVVVDADGERTVYDLRLAEVFVTKVTDTNGVDRVELTYGAISLTTTTQNDDGSAATPHTFSWNLATTEIGTEQLDAADPGDLSSAAPGEADAYYLTLSGVDGGVRANDHEGSFAVKNFSFDIEQVIDTAGGSGKGKAEPGPLIVDLVPGSSLTVLLKNDASGKHFDLLRLQGVVVNAHGERTVYDLRLAEVFVTKVTDTNGVDRVELTYGAVSLTTTAQNDDGSAAPSYTFSWNVATTEIGTGELNAADPGPLVSAAPGEADAYYLTIDGVDGGVRADGHEGSFAVKDFSFDIEQVVDTAGGSGKGKAEPGPLIVDLVPGSSLTVLLKNDASGKHFGLLRLQGVIVDADGERTVYDLRLAEAFVTKVTDTNGVDRVEFTYKAISLTTTAQNEDSSTALSHTFSWNVATTEISTGQLDAADPGPLVSAAPGEADAYYLTIDGVDGGVRADGHEGAFAVKDFSFDIEQVVDTAGGSGKGKAEPGPLIVDLVPGSSLTVLLKNDASGKHFDLLRLQGVVVDADGERTVYDLRLAEVFVTKVTDTNGVDRLEFTYKAISLTTTALNEDNNEALSHTFSWNVATTEISTGQLDPAVAGPLASAAPGEADAYYLTIDGLDGGVRADHHKGSFAVKNFTFDIEQVVDSAGGSGKGKGKAEPGPLIVDLVPGSSLTELLKHDASGKHFDLLRLQGVIVDADGERTVYDLRLAEVFVTKVTDTNGVDRLEFTYGAISLTTMAQSEDSSTALSHTFSWNVATTEIGTGQLDAADPGDLSSAAPGEADAYYLTIDGVDGGVRADHHKGSFAVENFTFDIEQVVDSASGTGSGKGKAEPGPLIVDLVPGSSLTELLKHDASGKHFDLLRLQGVIVDAGGERTVYDLRLAEVFVTKVTDTNGVDRLEFTYKAISLTTTGQNEGNGAAPSQTFSWNVATTEIGGGQLDAAVPGATGADAVTSNEATIAIDIAAVNDAPAVGAITLPSIQVNSGAHLITEAQLLANAHDIDGDTLHVTSLTIEKAFGTLVDNGDHTWTYTPKINDDTDARFVFQVSDGKLSTAGHATMDITSAQSAPAIGSPGSDMFTAVTGNSQFDGGLGVDTITFNFKLVDATVTYLDNKIIIDGPTSHTVLAGIEVFKFTDGTVNNDDGNPLVDDLFYYSRYHDVWTAHLDADADYNATGWHLGRDPSFFFSTSTYLSANPDVKAAGVNPLTHFDTTGWKEGRVPSIHFGPEQYLDANPDVAAAHVDPLRHYLTSGYQEGRSPIAPSELMAANGFDYVYYLNHNPDVAASGADPLQHFQQFGWKEGRNPNALFDVNGYLNTYGDVKAAGINPLDHYNQFGWHEGRDPSVGFDTTSYLAAYADVNAAHVNPLTHFLQFGIHEARSPFADGVWG